MVRVRDRGEKVRQRRSRKERVQVEKRQMDQRVLIQSQMELIGKNGYFGAVLRGDELPGLNGKQKIDVM